MNHVELTPYPFPESMAIPRLMPFQEFPWNGDGYLAAEVLRLKEAHGLRWAIETGTCLGSTSLWLAQNFIGVSTGEISPEYRKLSKARFALCGTDNVFVFDNGGMAVHVGMNDRENFIFLDAHWGAQCPLLEELEVIADHARRSDIEPFTPPCIIIHDFVVPGKDFGFDKMPDGRPFNLDLIHEHLNAIYGEGGWKHNYPTKVEGARRGWISIEPVHP